MNFLFFALFDQFLFSQNEYAELVSITLLPFFKLIFFIYICFSSGRLCAWFLLGLMSVKILIGIVVTQRQLLSAPSDYSYFSLSSHTNEGSRLFVVAGTWPIDLSLFNRPVKHRHFVADFARTRFSGENINQQLIFALECWNQIVFLPKSQSKSDTDKA